MYPARPTGCPSPASQRPRRPCGTANRYLRTSRRRLNNAKTIEQQDGVERALNKLARTFTAQRKLLSATEFLELQTGWTMLRDDGWYAYYNEEKPLGPFATEAGSGASRAKGVAKRNGPRRLVLGPPPRSRLRVTVVSAFRPGIKRPPRRKTSSTKVAWWL